MKAGAGAVGAAHHGDGGIGQRHIGFSAASAGSVHFVILPR